MNGTILLAIVAAGLAAALIITLYALAAERRRTTPERIQDLASDYNGRLEVVR